jgi:hypothetical protein
LVFQPHAVLPWRSSPMLYCLGVSAPMLYCMQIVFTAAGVTLYCRSQMPAQVTPDVILLS